MKLSFFATFLQQKGVGMHEKLIDEDNYPRSDVDVYAVRVARNRIICKKIIFVHFCQFYIVIILINFFLETES